LSHVAYRSRMLWNIARQSIRLFDENDCKRNARTHARSARVSCSSIPSTRWSCHVLPCRDEMRLGASAVCLPRKRAQGLCCKGAVARGSVDSCDAVRKQYESAGVRRGGRNKNRAQARGSGKCRQIKSAPSHMPRLRGLLRSQRAENQEGSDRRWTPALLGQPASGEGREQELLKKWVKVSCRRGVEWRQCGGRAGRREGRRVGKRGSQTKGLWLRLEFVAKVRHAVGKGGAHPNMVKGWRRKVSSDWNGAKDNHTDWTDDQRSDRRPDQ
jgi:hypothetical protein